MKYFIFVGLLIFSGLGIAGEFLSHIDFAGKTIKLNIKEWGYYKPNDLMGGKYNVLESADSKGLLGFHSVETQIKDRKKTVIEDFTRKCLIKLPTVKQKRKSSIITINGKKLCRQEFTRRGEVSLQYMLPSSLFNGMKNAYRMNILTFSFPEKSKDATKTIDSLLKELI